MFAIIQQLSTLGRRADKHGSARRQRKLQCETMERRDMFSVNPLSVPVAPAAAQVALADVGPVLVGDGGGNQANANDQPHVFVDDAQPVEEGNSIQFTIRLDRATDVPIRVHYRTVDGTAIGSQAVGSGDYHATDRSNSLVFMPGETEKTVIVATNDDSHAECAETLRLYVWKVASPRPVGFGDTTGVGTILDNDSGQQDDAACPNEHREDSDDDAVRQSLEDWLRDLYDGPADDFPSDWPVVPPQQDAPLDGNDEQPPANENKGDVDNILDDAIFLPLGESTGEAFVFFGPYEPAQDSSQGEQAEEDPTPQLPSAQDVLDCGNPNIDWNGSWGHGLFEGLSDDEIRAEYQYYRQSVQSGVRYSPSDTQPLGDIFLRISRLEGEMIYRDMEFGDDVRPDDVPEDGGFSQEHQRSTQRNERRAENEGFTNTDYARMPFFTQDEIDRAKTAPVEIYEDQESFALCVLHGLHALIATYAAEHGGDVPTVGTLTQKALEKGWLTGVGDGDDALLVPHPDDDQRWIANPDINFVYEHTDALAAQFGWDLQRLPNGNRAVALHALQQSVQRGDPVMIVYRTNPNSDPVAASEGDGGGAHVAIVQGFTFQDGEQYVIAKQPHNNLDHVWNIDDFLASWHWDVPMFVVGGTSD